MITYLIVLVVGICAGAFLDHHFSGKLEAVLTRVETVVHPPKS